MTAPFVLASGSAIRRRLLAAAGLVFVVDPADVDEDVAIADPREKARALAEKKAVHVSRRRPGALVVGSDQVGVIEGGAELAKPRDLEDAVRQLLAMAGRTHAFFPAAALARDGKVLDVVDEAVRVTFRAFGEEEARAYARLEEWRGSAGGYRFEERGALLVESVDGPTHAVLGLPLLALLRALRGQGAL